MGGGVGGGGGGIGGGVGVGILANNNLTHEDGAQQTSSATIASQDEIPYTSYSLSLSPAKGGGATSASSGGSSSSTTRGFFGSSNNNNNNDSDAGIITIKVASSAAGGASSASASANLEEEERELNALRPLQPILKSAVTWPFTTLPKDVETIDPKPFVTICHDFQEYCRRNAAMVVQQEVSA